MTAREQENPMPSDLKAVLAELERLLAQPHLTVTPIRVRGNEEYSWLQGADGVFAHSPAGMNPNDAHLFAALRNHAPALLQAAQEAERLREACQAAYDHVTELREAWMHGALSERDGQGGTRSNRNVDVQRALSKALNGGPRAGKN